MKTILMIIIASLAVSASADTPVWSNNVNAFKATELAMSNGKALADWCYNSAELAPSVQMSIAIPFEGLFLALFISASLETASARRRNLFDFPSRCGLPSEKAKRPSRRYPLSSAFLPFFDSELMLLDRDFPRASSTFADGAPLPLQGFLDIPRGF